MTPSFLRNSLWQGFGAFLFVLGAHGFCDSPLTSTPFHQAYLDVEEVARAAKQRRLDESLAQFLLDGSTPLDVCAAVINALSWDIEGKSDAEFLKNYRTRQDPDFPNRFEAGACTSREYFLIGYLQAMDHYHDVTKAMEILDLALEKNSASFTVALCHALVRAQLHLDSLEEWCEVWRVVDNCLQRFPVRYVFRKSAVEEIMSYIEIYKPYCKGEPR